MFNACQCPFPSVSPAVAQRHVPSVQRSIPAKFSCHSTESVYSFCRTPVYISLNSAQSAPGSGSAGHSPVAFGVGMSLEEVKRDGLYFKIVRHRERREEEGEGEGAECEAKSSSIQEEVNKMQR